jgi:hypothetical protein
MAGAAAAEMVEPMGERRVVSLMRAMVYVFLEDGQFMAFAGSEGPSKSAMLASRGITPRPVAL